MQLFSLHWQGSTVNNTAVYPALSWMIYTVINAGVWPGYLSLSLADLLPFIHIFSLHCHGQGLASLIQLYPVLEETRSRQLTGNACILWVLADRLGLLLEVQCKWLMKSSSIWWEKITIQLQKLNSVKMVHSYLTAVLKWLRPALCWSCSSVVFNCLFFLVGSFVVVVVSVEIIFCVFVILFDSMYCFMLCIFSIFVNMIC